VTQKKFPVCAINIACNPHPEKIYERLIAAAFSLRRTVSIHGDRHALLLQLDAPATIPISGRRGVKGVLATFLDLDIDAPWFDTAELKVVKEAKKETIRIPESLRPNMAEFHFVLDVEAHILTCQSRTEIIGKRTHTVKMTGKMLAIFFGELFASEELEEEFGDVEVTPVPDADKVEQILRSKLRKLSIVLRAPNPDSLEDLSEDIQKRMLETQSKELVESASAKRGEVLKPDERMRNLAEVAALNGRVEATIETPAGVKHVSTLEIPAEFVVRRDSRELDSVVIDRASQAAVEKIQTTQHRGRSDKAKGRRKRKKREH
jgi:hypothetical protein